METLLMYAWLSLILLLCYSLFTLFVMEFAVDYSQPKTHDGELRIKTKGFVVKEIYKGNIWRHTSIVPKNICQLFRGIFTGMIWFTFAMAIGIFFGSIIIIVRVIQIPIAFFLGYLPIYPKESFGDILFSGSINRFKPYQCYGKYDEKKWIAPWKIVIPIVMLIYYKITWQVVTVSAEFTGSLFTIDEAVCIAIAIALIIILIAVIAAIYNLIKKAGIGTATKEFFKSLKDRACLRVVPADADKAS